MFFSNPITTVAYLTSTSLTLAGKDLPTSEVLTLPKGVIKKLELVDLHRYREAIIDFLSKSPLSQQTVLFIIGDDLLYTTTIPLTAKEALVAQADEFFAKAPFAKELVVRKTLASDETVYLVATNRALYETAMQAFQAVGWEVDAVVPALLYEAAVASMTPETAKDILNNKKAVALGDFLEDNPPLAQPLPVVAEKEAVVVSEKEEKETKGKKEEKRTAKEEKEEEKTAPVAEATETVAQQQPVALAGGMPLSDEKKSSWKKIIMWVSIIFVLFLVGYGIWWSREKLAASMVQPTPTPTFVAPTPTVEPTPTVAAKPKDEVKVQIQNGTGTPGQARKVSTALEKLGYEDIETGNAADDTNEKTTITFADTIAKEDQEAIVASLEKLFETVAPKTGDTAAFDIVIITGTEK